LTFFIALFTIFCKRFVDGGGYFMSVKVREKRGRLYPDIYRNGERKWEALHLTLAKDKAHNKEGVPQLPEICRSKKEMQLVSGEWDIQDPAASKKNLTAYLIQSP
jgi:hypothetical protein